METEDHQNSYRETVSIPVGTAPKNRFAVNTAHNKDITSHQRSIDGYNHRQCQSDMNYSEEDLFDHEQDHDVTELFAGIKGVSEHRPETTVSNPSGGSVVIVDKVIPKKKNYEVVTNIRTFGKMAEKFKSRCKDSLIGPVIEYHYEGSYNARLYIDGEMRNLKKKGTSLNQAKLLNLYENAQSFKAVLDNLLYDIFGFKLALVEKRDEIVFRVVDNDDEFNIALLKMRNPSQFAECASLYVLRAISRNLYRLSKRHPLLKAEYHSIGYLLDRLMVQDLRDSKSDILKIADDMVVTVLKIVRRSENKPVAEDTIIHADFLKRVYRISYKDINPNNTAKDNLIAIFKEKFGTEVGISVKSYGNYSEAQLSTSSRPLVSLKSTAKSIEEIKKVLAQKVLQLIVTNDEVERVISNNKLSTDAEVYNLKVASNGKHSQSEESRVAKPGIMDDFDFNDNLGCGEYDELLTFEEPNKQSLKITNGEYARTNYGNHDTDNGQDNWRMAKDVDAPISMKIKSSAVAHILRIFSGKNMTKFMSEYRSRVKPYNFNCMADIKEFLQICKTKGLKALSIRELSKYVRWLQPDEYFKNLVKNIFMILVRSKISQSFVSRFDILNTKEEDRYVSQVDIHVAEGVQECLIFEEVDPGIVDMDMHLNVMKHVFPNAENFADVISMIYEVIINDEQRLMEVKARNRSTEIASKMKMSPQSVMNKRKIKITPQRVIDDKQVKARIKSAKKSGGKMGTNNDD